MHTGRIVFSIITTLVVAGLLVLGGVALYNAGWSQGYGTAALSASAGTAATAGQAIQPAAGVVQPAVIAPYAYGYPLYRPWFFGPWTCLFPILALFGFFFLMRLLFFPFFGWGMHRRRWMMEGHPGWGGWHEGPTKPEEGKESTPENK